jgi:hypothetical protein
VEEKRVSRTEKMGRVTGRDGGGTESLFKHIIAKHFMFASMDYAPPKENLA